MARRERGEPMGLLGAKGAFILLPDPPINQKVPTTLIVKYTTILSAYPYPQA